MKIKREHLKTLIEQEMQKLEETWGPGKDHEGRLARSQLNDLIQNAQALYNQLDEGSEMPGWIQAKITLASDYIAAAIRSADHEKVTGPIGEEMPPSPEDSNAPVIDRIKELYREWKPSTDDKWATKYKDDIGRVIQDFDSNANLG
jgi:hypothetical protein